MSGAPPPTHTHSLSAKSVLTSCLEGSALAHGHWEERAWWGEGGVHTPQAGPAAARECREKLGSPLGTGVGGVFVPLRNVRRSSASGQETGHRSLADPGVAPPLSGDFPISTQLAARERGCLCAYLVLGRSPGSGPQNCGWKQNSPERQGSCYVSLASLQKSSPERVTGQPKVTQNLHLQCW